MESYSPEFGKMQEEALNRLREMQKRSRTAVNRPNSESKPPPEQQDPRANQQNQQTRENRRAPQQDILKNLFGDVKADPEKILILLMLFVLYKNKADLKLLLALGYLLI